ncbi:hypothetical protein [Priestia megaterium]|uniref:hypothetical protein n=1 Tax=Priestia megaterium TaxID=1404 RepID=UPI00362E2015
MTKIQKINKLAMEIQSIKSEKQRLSFSNSLFEAMYPWIERKAQWSYRAMKAYKGEYAEIKGCIENGILRWVINQDGHEPYDSEKGNFIGYIRGHVRNEISKYKYRLTADKRSISHEKLSLNAHLPDNNEKTYGNLTANTEQTPLEDSCNFKLDMESTLTEFAMDSKNGEKKADVVEKLINYHKFDKQNVAETLGFDSYTPLARQKVKRIKQEFARYLILAS